LIVGSMYYYFATSSMSDPWSIVSMISYWGLCMMAALYAVFGYKKKAALYFKLFCWTFVLHDLIAVVLLVRIMDTLGIIMLAMSFFIIAVIAVTLNLGKRNSYILAIANILLFVVMLVRNIIGGFPFSAPLSAILASVILLVMVFAKYRDKDARGTE